MHPVTPPPSQQGSDSHPALAHQPWACRDIPWEGMGDADLPPVSEQMAVLPGGAGTAIACGAGGTVGSKTVGAALGCEQL